MKTYQLPQMEKGFMRKLFATLALLSLPLASQANLNCYWGDPLCWPPFIKEMEFKLGTGYRQDNFYWNVGGFEDQFNDDEGFPEIATEVMWKDLNIWTVNGELEVINAVTCSYAPKGRGVRSITAMYGIPITLVKNAQKNSLHLCRGKQRIRL